MTMSTQVEWGIVTKFPGDEKDYRLLASSQTRDPDQNYFTMIRELSVGELLYESNHRWAGAPRYIFGIVENPLRQIIIEQKWTGYGDRHNRPAQIMTCLLIPFEDLAQSACGYQQMAELFSSQQVTSFLGGILEQIKNHNMLEGQPLIEITLPAVAESLDRLVQAVNEIGLSRCLQLSNALLSQPMGLIWRNRLLPPREIRLQWLDGIMALFPYGMRAHCPASSWASGSTHHKVRLYWTDRALETHYPAWVDYETESIPSLQDSEFIRLEKTILLHTELKNLVSHLASLVEPTDFDHPGLERLLDEYGKIFVVFEELRTSAKLSSGLQASALELIKQQRLLDLSLKNQVILINKLLPYLKPSDAVILAPIWGDDIAEQILADAIGESSLIKLRIIAQVVYQLNQLNEFLAKIRTELDRETLSRDLLFKLLVYIPYDARKSGLFSGFGESQYGLFFALTKFVSDFSLSEEDILSWISQIAQRQGQVQEAVFRNSLERIPVLGNTKSTSFIGELKEVWLAPDGLHRITDEDIDSYGTIKLIALIQSAIILKKNDFNFLKAFTRLYTEQYDQSHSRGEMPASFLDLLNIPDEELKILCTKASVLLDVMRITAGVPQSLALVDVLKDGNDHRLKEYISELRAVLARLTQDDKPIFRDRIQESLKSLLPGAKSTGDFIKHLVLFVKEFSEMVGAPLAFRDVVIPMIKRDIEIAIDNKEPPETMLEVCKPLLRWEFPEINPVDDRENFDLLISIFKEKHYPDSSDTLWRLLRYFVAFRYQKRAESHELERTFHEAVTSDGVLTEISEKKLYFSELYSQILHSIEDLKFVRRFLSGLPDGRILLDQNKNIIHELINQLFREI